MSQSPVPGPGPLCPPRRLPLRPLCLRRPCRAPPPRRQGSGHPRRLRPRRGGGWLVLGSGGLGGDEVSGVRVDVAEVGVVVVLMMGVVRHMLDARGDALHRLHVRLRGRPAPRSPHFAPPSPCGSRAPSCLSPGAHGALALALGSLPGPHAFVPLSPPWVPPPVTCALACTAGARILPVPVSMPLAAPPLADRAPLHSTRSVAARLGALLALLRDLPVPLPFLRSMSRVVPPANRALSPFAAAGLGTLPALSPLLLAACAQACPLHLSLGTPLVASCPPLRAPLADSLPRLRGVPPLLDPAPGVLLSPPPPPRHIHNFTYSSSPLTALINKTTPWRWTAREDESLQELKKKIASSNCLGIPRPKGEIVLISDASDAGGGGTIYQWHELKPAELTHCHYHTSGLNRDGSLKHDYPTSEWRLVPLGHWNWKKNQGCSNYSTYDQELLAGMLVLSSQSGLLGSNPIVWLCDQEPVKSF